MTYSQDINQIFSKELTEKRNNTLRKKKNYINCYPNLQRKLHFPATLKIPRMRIRQRKMANIGRFSNNRTGKKLRWCGTYFGVVHVGMKVSMSGQVWYIQHLITLRNSIYWFKFSILDIFKYTWFCFIMDQALIVSTCMYTLIQSRVLEYACV